MPASKTHPPIEPKSRALLIDEFGELYRQISLLAPRHAALKKEINGWFETSPAAEPVTVEGTLYRLSLTPKRLSRCIRSMPKLFKLLGVRRFLQFADFPIGEAEKFIAKDRFDEYVQSERSGARSITATPLSTPTTLVISTPEKAA